VNEKVEDEPKTRVLETPTPGPPVRASIVARRRIGAYELVRRVAHGGMATVYLGRQVGAAGFEKVVALKLIHPHLADEPEFLSMFLDEARIAARLHHPHVVEILNLGVDDGAHYMVMEYVEGATLSALSRAHEGPLPLEVALRIVGDALEGLAAAHELKDRDGKPYDLVHRDVSPQNLLISLDGHLKVTDFGIMKAAGRHARTRTGELRGKVAYMSPEHASENRTDARSDVFAIGVIAWELIAGRRLFAEASDAATLKRVIACDVPPLPDDVLQDLEDETVQAIRGLLSGALAGDPDERFSSARTMLGKVRAVLKLLGTVDARDQLSALMRDLFAERAAYLRAALRDRSIEAVEPVGDDRTPGSGLRLVPEVADDATPSDAGGSVTTTLTTTSPPGPRQWAPWLLLPIAGAVIAVVAMRVGGPEPAAPTAPATAPATEIHWYISTDPEGASVGVNGIVHPEPTPTEVVVPRGPPVTLTLTKDGMRPTKAVLRPMNDDNLFYRLEPSAPAGSERKPGESDDNAAVAADAADPPKAAADPASALRPKPRVKTGAPRGGEPTKRVRRDSEPDPSPDAKSESEGDTGSSTAPGFKPMPDFDESAD
jgi:serine/threonine-protein kinase